MKEREFQKQILDFAADHGWRSWHVPTPMRPIGSNKFVPDPRGRGLPDLILLRADPPQIVFAEVKNEDGDVAPEQHEFLHLARSIAHDMLARKDYDRSAAPVVQAFLWRPANWDLIRAVLSAR